MDDEWRFSPGGVAAIIVIILAVGLVAYSIGRFGDEEREPPEVEFPDAGPPAPAIDQNVPTPAKVPPTVTPSLAVVIEKSSTRPPAMVQGSSQIVVPVAPAVATAPVLAPGVPTVVPSPRRQIVVEIAPTSRPEPTPTEPELEREPPPQETPSPPPPPRDRYAGGSPASIWSLGRTIAFSFAPRSTHTKQDL